jgi:hypothetical protein
MDLLKQLYTIHAPFYREWPMICFIREYIRQHVPEAEVQMDGWGNLYIKKGLPYVGKSEVYVWQQRLEQSDRVQWHHILDLLLASKGKDIEVYTDRYVYVREFSGNIRKK